MDSGYRSRRLLILFLGNLIILSTGTGLFPILPLYAGSFGASSSQVGLFLGLVYFAIASGTLLAGWLLRVLPVRRLMIAGTSLGIPALLLLGQARSFWQVVVLTSLLWLAGGVGLAVINTATGLLADREKRGKVFGLMGLAVPLGALAGGAAVSGLIVWQGYSGMFSILSGLWAALPAAALLGLPLTLEGLQSARQAGERGSGFQKPFILLLVATLLAITGMSAGRLGVSLSMEAQGFSPAQTAGTSTAGGLLIIPLVLAGSYISDRLPRRHLLIVSYLLFVLSALILGAASQLWHFWLAAAALLLAGGFSGSISSALTTDLLAPGTLGRGLSWLNSTIYAANMIAFTGSGILVEKAGMPYLYLAAALLPLAAIAVVLLIASPRGSAQVEIDLQVAVTSTGDLDRASQPAPCN